MEEFHSPCSGLKLRPDDSLLTPGQFESGSANSFVFTHGLEDFQSVCSPEGKVNKKLASHSKIINGITITEPGYSHPWELPLPNQNDFEG